MGNPLDSSQFVRLLDERLYEVSEGVVRNAELKSMIPRLFRIVASDSAWEEFYSVGDVPNIPEFNSQLTYLSQVPGYLVRIEPKEYAAGLQAERKLIDDKKYDVLDNRARGLMKSAMRRRELEAVRAFTTSFSSAYDYMSKHEENVSLCNNSHSTKAGTSTSSGFDNLGTTKFSKTVVDSTRLAMRLFRSDISQRIEIGDRLGLVVPDALADDAWELVKTRAGFDSGEGNVNMDYGRYEVIPYMHLDDTDTNNWWMVDLDRMKEDLIWMDRIYPETKNTVDFETYMLKQAVYARMAHGFRDWRWVYGHNVS